MDDLNQYRKQINRQQTELRAVLTSGGQFEDAMALFMTQHAILHTAKITADPIRSYADAVVGDMTEDQVRRIPKNCDHSAAWLLWHIARIEDTTMNVLVADGSQVLQDDWIERLDTTTRDTGNAMARDQISAFSTGVNIAALLEYRLAVGRRTREIAAELSPEALKRKVAPAGLQRLLDEGAVAPVASGLLDYWGNRDIAGLLLMPATRHCFVHLNEIAGLKKRQN